MNRPQIFFDQRRPTRRPKNVAGEYGQLWQDFKTSDTPGFYKSNGVYPSNSLAT